MKISALALILTISAHFGVLAAEPVEVSVALAHPKLPAQKTFTTYLKVGITGKNGEGSHSRPPVNVALVLDRSGSMMGLKMEQAKQAAVTALEKLGAGDIVSVVAFDNEASAIMPATKLTQREDVVAAIRKIQSGGGTALFAGLTRGANEVRKFKAPQMVSRIVLLSDGKANVGPSSADEMERYGISLAKENVSVTTVGLGLDYNEKLMAGLARTSDGNHAFIREPSELAAVFTEEFGDILSVVAQEMRVSVVCLGGVRPVRVLGREARIHGGVVEVAMNQLRAGQQKYVLLEVEVPAGASGSQRLVGDVTVSYRENESQGPKVRNARVKAGFVNSDQEVAAAASTPILVEVATQIGMEKQMIAVRLADEGKTKEAEQVFLENAGTLRLQARRFGSADLSLLGDANINLNGANTNGGEMWQTYRNAAVTMGNNAATQNASSNITSNTAALANNGFGYDLNPSLPTLKGSSLLPEVMPPGTIQLGNGTGSQPRLRLIQPSDSGSLKVLPGGGLILTSPSGR